MRRPLESPESTKLNPKGKSEFFFKLKRTFFIFFWIFNLNRKGPASPKSPGQQKKGKQGTKWEEDIDPNSLNYGETEAASRENGSGGASASASAEDLSNAYQYLSVRILFIIRFVIN